MNVFEKLSKARLEFHQLELRKSGHNKFAGYRYFELGDFLVPALKVFDRNRLCPVISFDAAMASMTITDLDDPSQAIHIVSPMAEAQLKGCHPVQNLGASQTYLRRYLWTAALEIVEHDAVDGTAALEPGPTKYFSVIAEQIEEFSLNDNAVAARELIEDLTPAEKRELWGLLSENSKDFLKKASKK